MPTILTIDDEEHLLELLKYSLEKEGYEVLQAKSAEDAQPIAKKQEVDLILLDYMLPGENGLQFLKWLRQNEQTKKIPVIMLTARNAELDAVRGFETGADDYVGKPFRTNELLARIKALLRRSGRIKEDAQNQREVIKIDNIVIDYSGYEVRIDGVKIDLSLKEFELLYLLAKNRGKVFDRERLLEKIWGFDFFGETRTVDVHIRNLRVKIEEDDKHPKYLKTVRGVGYKFS